MKFYRILLLLALLLASNVQFAQNAEEEKDKLSLDEGPISNSILLLNALVIIEPMALDMKWLKKLIFLRFVRMF